MDTNGDFRDSVPRFHHRHCVGCDQEALLNEDHLCKGCDGTRAAINVQRAMEKLLNPANRSERWRRERVETEREWEKRWKKHVPKPRRFGDAA